MTTLEPHSQHVLGLGSPQPHDTGDRMDVVVPVDVQSPAITPSPTSTGRPPRAPRRVLATDADSEEDADEIQDPLREGGSGPWPSLSKYVRFINQKPCGNYQFQCMSCKPKVVNLAVSLSTKHNIRRHFGR